MNFYSFYPKLTHEIQEKAGLCLTEFTYGFYDNESEGTLQTADKVEELIEKGWAIENDGLVIQCQLTVENPQALLGVDGIAPTGAEIGYCLVWKNIQSDQKGYSFPIRKSSSVEEIYEFKHEFYPGEISESLILEFIVYLSEESKEVPKNEAYLGNTKGLVLGIVESFYLSLINKRFSLPVKITAADSELPAWWIDLNWNNPKEDEFNESTVCLHLNPHYLRKMPRQPVDICQDPFMLEVFSSAFFLILQKIDSYEPDLLAKVIKRRPVMGGESEQAFSSNSICQVMNSALKKFAGVSYDSPEVMHRSLRAGLSKLLAEVEREKDDE